MRIYVSWPRRVGRSALAAALAREATSEGEGHEMSVINPPGPDWHDRLYRRLREALERARRDDCDRCGGEERGFRHFAYPSECRGTSR